MAKLGLPHSATGEAEVATRLELVDAVTAAGNDWEGSVE